MAIGIPLVIAGLAMFAGVLRAARRPEPVPQRGPLSWSYDGITWVR